MATSTRTKSNAKAKQEQAPAEPEPSAAEDFADDENLFADWDEDPDDLLDDVLEDDSEGWNPDEPEGISGVVVKISKTKSDFEDDPAKAMVPTWTIQTKQGTKWRVIGFSAVLRREMQDAEEAGLETGDLAAVKYFGERTLKRGKFAGKPYKHYGVAYRKAKHEQA